MYFSVVPTPPPTVASPRFRNTAFSPLGRVLEGGCLPHSLGVSPWRRYPRHALVLLFDGAGRYRDETGADRSLAPGDLIVVRPGVAHAYGPGPGEEWSEFYLAFDGPVFALWQERGLLLDATAPPVRRLEPVDDWRRRFETVLSPGEDPLGDVCRLQTLFAEILAHRATAGPSAGDARWLARARAWLDADLTGERSIPALAREMHVSVETFRRRFTRLAGMSPGRYRTARRMDRASEWLRVGRTLRDVAEAVGFCDEFHFSRRFKRVTGQSPGRFREQMRAASPPAISDREAAASQPGASPA